MKYYNIIPHTTTFIQDYFCTPNPLLMEHMTTLNVFYSELLTYINNIQTHTSGTFNIQSIIKPLYYLDKKYDDIFYDYTYINNELNIYNNDNTYNNIIINCIIVGDNLSVVDLFLKSIIPQHKYKLIYKKIIETQSNKHIKYNDDINQYHDIINQENIKLNSIDIICYNLKNNESSREYIIDSIFILIKILFLQNNKGMSIIRLQDIRYNGILSMIYVLCYVFNNIYIINPITGLNISLNDITQYNTVYIICKGYVKKSHNFNNIIINYYNNLINTNPINPINNANAIQLSNVVNNHIPLSILYKLEDNYTIYEQYKLYILNLIIDFLLNDKDNVKFVKYREKKKIDCINWGKKYNLISTK
jgi:hypothetical protein